MSEKIPCDDSLSAMPGDKIKFLDRDGLPTEAIVDTAGWLPSPKGGKVWTYETVGGDKVSSFDVMSVTKHRKIPTEAMQNKRPLETGEIESDSNINITDYIGNSVPPEIYLRQELMMVAESLNLQSMYKVVFSCILEDDYENIKVAADLLKIRARQLKELEEAARAARFANGIDPIQPTNIPLKEENNGQQ